MKKNFWALFALLCILLFEVTAQADYLDLPEMIKEIEAEAFMGDTSIDSVYLPEGLETIGSHAFAYSSVEWIYMPESLTYIAPDAFEGCENLEGYGPDGTYACNYFTEHEFPYERDVWVDDFLIISWEGEDWVVDGYYGKDRNITIPSTFGNGKMVTSISSYFHSGNINSVFIETGIKRIEDDAFARCPLLKKVNIPQSVEYIGDSVFSNSGIITISCEPGSYAENWANLHGIMIDEWSLESEENASDLNDFVFNPLSDTTCEVTDYLGNDPIVNIPQFDADGRTVIAISGGYGYYPEKKHIKLVLPDTIEQINQLFPSCYIFQLYISKSVSFIDANFRANSGCSSVIVSEENKNYEVFNQGLYDTRNSALVFQFDSDNYAVNIREGTRILGEWSINCGFRDEGIDVVLPESLEVIERYAFSTKVKSVDIPKNVYYIGEIPFGHLGYDGFEEKITLSPQNPYFEIYDGCLYSIEDSRLICALTDQDSFTIREGTTSISTWAFGYLKNCKSISIPETVNYIGFLAFGQCNQDMELIVQPGSYAETYAIEESLSYNSATERNITGAFSADSISINCGEKKQVSGSVTAKNVDLSRVTLTVSGYSIENDDSDRYATVDLSDHGLRKVNLADYPIFCLDTTRAPLNVPGTYIVNLWASVEGSAEGQLLDSMTVTVEAAGTVTLSGKTITASGAPIADAGVIVANSAIPNTVLAVTYTDKNGNWSVYGLKADIDYIASYWHSDYTFDTTSTNPGGAAVIGTLCGEDNGVNISFTMSQNGQEVSSTVVGTAVDFAIDAPGASYVRLVVDGTAYEEYMLDNDGQGLFSRVFSQAGARQVAFQVIKQGEYEYGTACSAKPLTVTGSDGSTEVATLPAATISAIADQIVGEDFDISWSQVENADKYHVYLYSGNFLMWDKEVLGEINTAVTVPSIDFDGTYTVVIMASGYGYNQSEASATVKVNKTGEALVIANANDIKSSVLGGSAFVEVNSVHPDLYKKLIITDPDNITTESDATQASQIYIDYHKTGTYYIRAIASNDINFNDSTALYTTDVVSIAVDTNPRIDYVTHDGKKGTYGLHYDTEDMPITVRNTFVADSVAVYEGDTLICEGVRSTTDNYWYAFDCVMPKEKLGEGKHTLTIKSYFNDAEGKPQLIDDYDYVAYIIDYVEDGTQYYLGVADRLLTSAPDLNDGFNKAAGTPVKLHGNYGTQKYVELGKGTYGFVSAELKNEWIVEEPSTTVPIINPEKIEVYADGHLGQRSTENIGEIPIWFVPFIGELRITLPADTVDLNVLQFNILFSNITGGQITITNAIISNNITDGTIIIRIPTSTYEGRCGTYYFSLGSNQSTNDFDVLMVSAFEPDDGRILYPSKEWISLYNNIYAQKSNILNSAIIEKINFTTKMEAVGKMANMLYVKFSINDVIKFGFVSDNMVDETALSPQKRGFVFICGAPDFKNCWTTDKNKIITLFNQYGVEDKDIITHAPCNKSGWEMEMNNWKSNNSGIMPWDTTYIYIGCHADGYEFFPYYPYDAILDPNDKLVPSGLSYGTIAAISDVIPGNIVFILDFCHTAELENISGIDYNRVAIIGACQKDEETPISNIRGTSIFLNELYKACKVNIDGSSIADTSPQNRKISVLEIRSAITHIIKGIANQRVGLQIVTTPYIKGNDGFTVFEQK